MQLSKITGQITTANTRPKVQNQNKTQEAKNINKSIGDSVSFTAINTVKMVNAMDDTAFSMFTKGLKESCGIAFLENFKGAVKKAQAAAQELVNTEIKDKLARFNLENPKTKIDKVFEDALKEIDNTMQSHEVFKDLPIKDGSPHRTPLNIEKIDKTIHDADSSIHESWDNTQVKAYNLGEDFYDKLVKTFGNKNIEDNHKEGFLNNLVTKMYSYGRSHSYSDETYGGVHRCYSGDIFTGWGANLEEFKYKGFKPKHDLNTINNDKNMELDSVLNNLYHVQQKQTHNLSSAKTTADKIIADTNKLIADEEVKQQKEQQRIVFSTKINELFNR